VTILAGSRRIPRTSASHRARADRRSGSQAGKRKLRRRIWRTPNFGITRDRAHELAELVQQAARDGDITKEASTIWGQYYRVDWTIPSRVDVVLQTIWGIAPGAEIPRLVSVFIR